MIDDVSCKAKLVGFTCEYWIEYRYLHNLQGANQYGAWHADTVALRPLIEKTRDVDIYI